MKTIARIGLAVVGMCALAVAAVASDVTIPNVFTSGTTASAAQVNANFAAVEASIDDNDARLDALAAGGVTSAYITDSTITTSDIALDTITAADIAADTITAADIATGAVTTTEILDGTIAAADLSAEAGIPRNATYTFSGLGLPTTWGSQGSVTINAPASGYVLVIYSGLLQLSGKTAGNYVSAYVGASTSATASSPNSYTRFYLSADVPAGTFEIPFSVHGIFPVSTGNNTFYAIGQENGASGSAAVYSGRITAIFIRY